MVLMSSTGMHNAALFRVLRSPVLFFDSNPSGRINTRFSKDIVVMDMLMVPVLNLVTMGVFRTVTVMISVVTVNPYIVASIVVSVAFMILIMKKAMHILNETQVKEGVYRAPIHQIMTTLVSGLTSVRALRKIAHFRRSLTDEVELSANTTFVFVATHRWLGVRLDSAALIFIFTVGILAVLLKDRFDASMLAFSLQIILDLVFFLSVTLRFYGEFENYTTSAQRIYDYTLLPIEDELKKKEDQKQIDAKWPQKGEVKFTNCEMRYRKDLDPALINLTMKIEAGMKVGIVGRTGAGKSSILQALFRLVELHQGTIQIDGVDIKDLGLHILRQNIAFIPQTPFLFQGSIRENLDPFKEFSDEEVKRVLNEV